MLCSSHSTSKLSPTPIVGMAGHALILNYTGLDYHFGCFATSVSLYNMLIDDGYSVSTLSVRVTHASDFAPDTADGLFNSERIEKFCRSQHELYNTINRATIVVVNGEGTLHGMNNAPRNLLYMMSVAGFHTRRPTYLVNHSLFPTDKAPQEDTRHTEFYRAALSVCDKIAVRDALSHDIYRAMGITVVPAFDSLPDFAQRAGLLASPQDRDDELIVIGVGVGFSLEQARDLAEIVRKTVPKTARIVFMNGAPRQEPFQEMTFPPAMMEIDPRMVLAEPAQARAASDGARACAWLGTIARARLVITGRYHHVIAALTFGTPVVALSSNTPKIEGTYKLLGFDHPVIEPREAGWTAELKRAITAALHGDAVVTTPEQRQQILRYAQANAVWRTSP